VEPEAQETVEAPPPKGDELLAELRQNAPAEMPLPERVELKLTLDEASFLYERLYQVVAEPPPMKLEAVLKDTFTVPPTLFRILDERLEEMRSTTPVSASKQGRVKFLQQSVTLEVRLHEAKYLRRILANKERDGWRREKLSRARFVPLEVVEIAEEGEDERAGRTSFYRSIQGETPDAQVGLAVLKKALGELPKKLKMSAADVTALLAALKDAEGNVSEAARQLGQPQRKTARRIERILRHLKSRGLSA
jgi:hypothetical protein